MQRNIRRLKYRAGNSISRSLAFRYLYIKTCLMSLFYNHHMNQNYIGDVLLEPMIWIVDNYSGLLGPFFVIAVFCLTSAIVFICWYIGFPYWIQISPLMTGFLVILGNYLLMNISFHYFMAAFTKPGRPPNKLISNAVSICKKCMSPKPPRTHHCSVCNACILKFDHHCPWLSNCVGFHNHRYFFLYMAWTCIGIIYMCIFGVGLAYDILWKYAGEEAWTPDEDPVGHPVRFNLSGHVIAVPEMNDYELDGIEPRKHDIPESTKPMYTATEVRMLIFTAITSISVLIALGTLTIWHAKQISRGETSVEAHINRSEMERHKKIGKIYVNPYDFGVKENWKRFLGLRNGRTFVKNVLFPSWHPPDGDGLFFETIYSNPGPLILDNI
ncbi:palmitoyltransferase ZDHHC16 [Culicoides brevitarsis]|uniref:palmitoyltransferase ZDHHC16 n=1 Tax=Culicoides brevitarsis TaxID=469753 RepID=UPI00307C9D0D